MIDFSINNYSQIGEIRGIHILLSWRDLASKNTSLFNNDYHQVFQGWKRD
jgi:hypothetical protein